jgi:hypothetical protein
LTVALGFVDKFGSFIGAQVISSKQTILVQPKAINLLFVNFIAQVYYTLNEKDYLINFIIFIKEYNLSFLLSGFKTCHNFLHKSSIVIVLPREYRGLVWILDIGKTEDNLVRIKKNLEQKLCVNRQLHVSRNLVKVI